MIVHMSRPRPEDSEGGDFSRARPALTVRSPAEPGGGGGGGGGCRCSVG